MEQERGNVAKLEEAYRLWHESKGTSADHWLSLLDDQVDFNSIGAGSAPMAFTAHRMSREEVRGYFDGLAADWEMIHFTVDEFVAQGDRVVMLGHCAFRSRKTGKEAALPKCDVWRFKDGRVVSFMEFFDTAKAFAAAQD